MNYGQSNALKILVAERMGLNPTMVEDAKQCLRGTPPHPITGKACEDEACRVHNLLCTDGTKVQEANTIALAIAAEYGF